MKVGVLNIYQFPVGYAATARILAYCGGLSKLGVCCEMISYVLKDDRLDKRGLCNSIPEGTYFHFAYAPQKKGVGKIKFFLIIYRRILNAYSMVKSLFHIFKSHKRVPFDYIILSFDNVWNMIFYVPLLRLMRIKLCAIADEYPTSSNGVRTTELPEWKIILYRLVNRGIEKRILITESLQRFYDNKICKKPTLIVSTIVNVDRFINVNHQKQNVEYLCYLGSLNLEKDNVDNIINAFSLVVDKYENLELRIYGIPNKRDKAILDNLINTLHMEDRIKLCGKVDYDDVPRVLCNAKILVMSQPQTKRSEGGFPTKVGEYLCSGVPAIFTDVGEISKYIQNNITGYLTKPCNPQEYAYVLMNILNNYSEALSVAKNAQSYIYDNFSGSIAGEKIINFLFD